MHNTKHIAIVAISFLSVSAAFSGGAKAPKRSGLVQISQLPQGYGSGHENNEYVVTAVDWSAAKVAFAHKFTGFFNVPKPLKERANEFDETKQVPPVECTYKELGGATRTGQIVGTYDLKSDKVESFFVTHKSVKTKKECSSAKDIQAALKAFSNAQAAYKFEPVKGEQIKTMPATFLLEGKEHKLTSDAKRLNEAKWLEYGYKDDDSGSRGITLLQVFDKGQVIYERPHEDYYAMAAGTNITTPFVVLNKNRALVFEVFVHTTADQGARNENWFHISPILEF